MRVPAGILLVSLLLVAGCGAGQPTSGEGVAVVATTTHVADLVRSVAGERARVTGLLAANSDPHDFEVRPGDLAALADARLVVRSGGEVDDWLGDAIESAGGDAPVLDLRGRVGAGDDPHWWQDPRKAQRALGAIATALGDADPGARAAFDANARAATARLERLDRAIAACMQSIPAERRKLVTSHDALRHFADRYGLEIVGAVIPSRSTAGQASARDTAALVETIRREDAPAVFAEQALSSRVEEAIAREAGATIGDPLYTDALGPEGSGADTYAGALAANARAIHAALAPPGAPACDLPDGDR